MVCEYGEERDYLPKNFMIVFLTQYYRGLGHCMRTKFIAEEVAKTHDVLVVDQLFDPPIS